MIIVIILILTWIVPSRQKSLNKKEYINEQEFNSSQIPANQEIYEQLDQSLVNQPREIYIETFLKSTHENEGYLESYRRILYDRACSIEGFPKGKLISRRDTSKCKSTHKLPSDCFVLQMFISGDNSEIESIFSKSSIKTEPDQSQSEINTNYALANDIASIKASIHTANMKIDNLEQKVKKLESEIQQKDKTIQQLKGKLDSTVVKTSRLDDEQRTKFATLDAFRKRTKTVLDSIGEFDNHVNEQRLQSMEGNIKTLSQQVSACNKNIHTMKTSASENGTSSNEKVISSALSKSSGNVPVPQPAPNSYRSLFQKDTVESQKSRVNESHNEQKSNTSEQRTAPLENRSQNSVHETRNSLEKSNIHEKHSVQLDNSSQSSVHEQRKTSETRDKSGNRPFDSKSTDYRPSHNKNGDEHSEKQNTFRGNKTISGSKKDDFIFVGAKRRRTTQFYIGNIDESSTYQGLSNYLYENKFHPTNIRLFRTKSRHMAARVSIPVDEADYMYDIHWPEKIVVKKWLSKQELQEQYESKQKQQYDNYMSYNEENDNSDRSYTYSQNTRDSYAYRGSVNSRYDDSSAYDWWENNKPASNVD